MAELDIKPIFNVGYSPEFNPIERVFSKVKRRFNAKRLVNKRGFNFDRTITAAFKEVTVGNCANCVKKSYGLLEQAAKGK